MTHSLRKVSSSLLFLVSLGGLGCGQATEHGAPEPAAAAGAGDADDAATPVSNAPARVDLRPSAEGGGRALPILPSADAGGAGPSDGAAGAGPNPLGDEPIAPNADTAPPNVPTPEATAPLAGLREVTQTLAAVPALTGVVSSSGHHYGFLTFDVAELPANVRKLERAVAHTGPYVVGEPVSVYHVAHAFDELGPAAVTADKLQLLTILPSGTSGALLIPTALVDVLVPDYLTRNSSHHYSQFRFDLPDSSIETDADATVMAGLLSAAKVDLQYLVP